MELLQIVFTSLASIFALFILTKLMGNRQMSQLNMFDYINGITIGSIAAEMATSLEDDFTKPLLAMIIYTLVSLIFSWSCSKSIVIRRVLTGKSLILVNNGKIFPKNLNKAHLDINEFLVQCRSAGYFDIADIEAAVLETNGKISFLPLAEKRPINPNDMNINPPEDKLVINIIIDGNVMQSNLKLSGNDEKWLEKELHKNGAKISEVFLATCDCKNSLKVYKYEEYDNTKDPFQ